MAVYVDDMQVEAAVPSEGHVVRGRWSHLMADSEDELRAFARKLGLQESWIQHPGEAGVHFDVTQSKRAQAIRIGAQQITWRQAGQMYAERIRSGEEADKPVSSLLLVSGPREGVSRETVAQALRPHFSPEVMLIAGGAGGVDTDAAQLWREWGGLVEEHKVDHAEWLAKPKTAGFERNDRMVQRVKTAGGKALVIDLPCSKPGCRNSEPHFTHGTSHCADSARKAGLDVEHYPAPAEPQQPPEGRVRHSWAEGMHEGQKACRHCGMGAEQRWNPATGRPVVIYSQGDRRLVAERVPPCGSELPDSGLTREEARHLAEAADRKAGEAYKAGDHDRAFRLLTDARVLDPAGFQTWNKHERQIREKVRAQQAVKPAEPARGDAQIQREAQEWALWNQAVFQRHEREASLDAHEHVGFPRR